MGNGGGRKNGGGCFALFFFVANQSNSLRSTWTNTIQ
jgi:hypothetical protein